VFQTPEYSRQSAEFRVQVLRFGVSDQIVAGPAEPIKTQTFMRLKLGHAQSVLEGLAVEDFDKISKNSQAMVLLSHESNWKVFQTPDYNQHSEDFRRIASSMTKHAKEKNLDAVALDYVLLTTNCVQCHKYVRSERSK